VLRPTTYRVVDPVRRTVVRSLTVDVLAALRPGELFAPHGVLLSPDGASVLVTINDHRPDSVSRPVAVVSVTGAGKVGRRVNLPPSGDGNAHEGGVWSVERATSGGALLVHSTARATEVVRLDMATGKREPLFVLPSYGPVNVPGRARY
jgi:hypothetical protein